VTARHTITEIGRKEDGVLYEAEGLPELADGVELPVDLRAFYGVCGGLGMQKIRMLVVPPSRFAPLDEAGRYLLAEKTTAPEEQITIDLGPENHGCCYAGSVKVASSFTSFLVRLARDDIVWS
jgi:hypothetical protein